MFLNPFLKIGGVSKIMIRTHPLSTIRADQRNAMTYWDLCEPHFCVCSGSQLLCSYRMCQREAVLPGSIPTKQRVVYQQARPQYFFVHEGKEEYEDGELCYAPAAPPQDPYALVRRPGRA